MKFTTLALVGSLVSIATAYVNPTEPWGETKWIPGSKGLIQWDDLNKDGPDLATNPMVDVFLMTGSDQVMVQLDVIATKVNAGQLRNLTYTVPTVDPIGKIYFIQFVSDKGIKAWSTRFTITDASGNPGTLAPTGAPGQNPGATGKIVSGGSAGGAATATSGTPGVATGTPSNSAAPGSATGSSSAPNPSTTAAGGKNSASAVSGSVISAAAAVAVGVAALMAF
ncbi:hypothetical protein BGZ96_007886 [Linnemannia gamsii]|uniref:Yeast cell wall synthesis Kre9/Knh1-like N-terminal domain-containing protein n=1 Tax=Linnemannia gamsii TaxID=64522 RepID=A0ABQ7K063_9FUNG|nr:hypothetical protein BGZ96_007886 [Linnemannia gamsii]